MVVKPKRLVKASQRRAKSFMLLYGSYARSGLRECRVKIVMFTKLDLTCLRLLAVTITKDTKHRVKVDVQAIMTTAEGMGCLYLICMNSRSIPMTQCA